MSEEGKLQNYSVDQVAGAFVLVLSAVSSLLLVLWQSKCLCKVNLCYIFQCERRPPSEEEMKGLKDQAQKLKDKKEDKKDKKDEPIVPPVLRNESVQSPREPEPEPEMLLP
tara:strand:- start:80 stop:412 length:333 start_codon:yes stop_codon:yes gene_type:complete